MASAIAKAAISSQLGMSKTGAAQSSTIRWEDFNYPPLLKLVHFSLDELNETQKPLVKKIYASFLIICVISLINFVNSIVQAAQGLKGIIVFYSILNMIIFLPVSLYCFYRGYRSVAYDESLSRVYKLLQGLLGLLYFVFSILGGGGFNGWVKVGFLFNNGFVFAGVLSLFESLLYTGNVALSILCIWLLGKHKFAGDARI